MLNNVGFVSEVVTNMAVFDPRVSTQLFKAEFNIGENVKTDNFQLFDNITNNDVDYLTPDITLDTIVENDETYLIINRNENKMVGLNFPAIPVRSILYSY